MISKIWDKYKNKKVRLIVEDIPHPRPKDGILIDIDDTHVFLQIQNKKTPVPFSKHSIKRIELKEVNEETEEEENAK